MKALRRKSRRRFLSNGAKSALMLAGAGYAPTIWSQTKFHVRVLGTHVTLQEELRKQAEQDLGISLSFEPGGSAKVLHQASTRPETFDL